MKVQLVPEKCIACGLCQTYSNIFDYDDEGIVILADSPLKQSATFENDPAILRAVSSCPTKAILAE